MDQALIPAMTALIVALATLMTAVATLAQVLKHGAMIEDTRNAVNGQAAKLDAAVGTMQAENAKRAAESS